jgi:hypothetical protein
LILPGKMLYANKIKQCLQVEGVRCVVLTEA